MAPNGCFSPLLVDLESVKGWGKSHIPCTQRAASPRAVRRSPYTENKEEPGVYSAPLTPVPGGRGHATGLCTWPWACSCLSGRVRRAEPWEAEGASGTFCVSYIRGTKHLCSCPGDKAAPGFASCNFNNIHTLSLTYEPQGQGRESPSLSPRLGCRGGHSVRWGGTPSSSSLTPRG